MTVSVAAWMNVDIGTCSSEVLDAARHFASLCWVAPTNACRGPRALGTASAHYLLFLVVALIASSVRILCHVRLPRREVFRGRGRVCLSISRNAHLCAGVSVCGLVCGGAQLTAAYSQCTQPAGSGAGGGVRVWG